MHNDFNLSVDIPKNRLCPTLPLRLNYIHFIEDLLNHCEIKENVVGVDIGSGASCVYCLLAVRVNPTWKMYALEVEEQNIESAKHNITKNQLEDKIIMIDQKNSEKIFEQLFEADATTKSFCLCNPPFYSSEHEMVEAENRTGKRKKLQIEQPSKETVFDGGELAFVTKIINESVILKDKIQIYSTMIGCKRNFDRISDVFKEHEINSFITTKFIQGKVQRWGVAWSFCKNLQTFKDHHSKSSEKSSNILKYFIDNKNTLSDVINRTKEILSNLKIEIIEVIEENDHLIKWKLLSKENTWSNQRRKRRAEIRNEQFSLSTQPSNQPEHDLMMGLEIFKDESEKIEIKMHYISGSMSKDCVNQILQQIKNKMN